jgi:hypothetical protein
MAKLTKEQKLNFNWQFLRRNPAYGDDFLSLTEFLNHINDSELDLYACERHGELFVWDDFENESIQEQAEMAVSEFSSKWNVSNPIDPKVKLLHGKMKFKRSADGFKLLSGSHMVAKDSQWPSKSIGASVVTAIDDAPESISNDYCVAVIDLRRIKTRSFDNLRKEVMAAKKHLPKRKHIPQDPKHIERIIKVLDETDKVGNKPTLIAKNLIKYYKGLSKDADLDHRSYRKQVQQDLKTGRALVALAPSIPF